MHPDSNSQAIEYRRQLLSPDFDGFESYFGCPVPPELRQFYELKERLLAGPLYATIRAGDRTVRYDLIQYALPMTSSNWTSCYGTEYFPFAVDVDGFSLLIKPALARSPVFVDSSLQQTTPDVDSPGFTLWEIVDSLGPRD